MTNQLIAKRLEVLELHLTKRKAKKNEDSKKQEKVNPVQKTIKTAI